jgi:DNA-binding beta-propeller fold protein YncE
MKLHPASGAVLLASMLSAASIHAAPRLELESTIPLPGVKGRIDHLSVDVKGHRLFVAALGNDTVEVLDTQHGQRRSIAGLGEPQGVLFLADANRLFIANGQADRIDIVDGAALSVLKRIADMPDADNVRYDAAARKVVVGYGRGALRFIDPATGESGGEIHLPGHPESFQLEQTGALAFVNVPSAHAVVVADRQKRSIVAQWPTPQVSSNFPMALDEASHRLFIGARSPAVLLVYDTESGKVAARVEIGGDTDDLFYDARRKRIYVVCGEGRVDVIRQDTPDSYVAESSIETAPRARTGLFVPEESRLYVAAPAVGSSAARVLVYRVQ